jgi:hypothetical protein
MKLNEFIEKFDHENSVVILAGKRDVADEDGEKLVSIGKLLASTTKHIMFRSGNASGADLLFSQGIVSVDNSRLEVVTPYTTHREQSNCAAKTYSLDRINIAMEPKVIYQSKFNKRTEKHVYQYVAGIRDKYAMKAAYIIRDTIMVIGTSKIKPASFGIFYDDLNNPNTGGTGHTMNICKYNKIPLINQLGWMKWLDQI